MSDALELTFETRIPVIGQIMALEAVDHLYSLFALAETDWRDDFNTIENWQQTIANLPGKLLPPDKTLRVATMYPGSGIEVLSGLVTPLENLVEFLLLYRQKKEAEELRQRSQKLQLVTDQLLPLIDKLRALGVPSGNIQLMVAKAHQLVEDVLDGMLGHHAIAVRSVTIAELAGSRCRTCGQVIGV